MPLANGDDAPQERGSKTIERSVAAEKQITMTLFGSHGRFSSTYRSNSTANYRGIVQCDGYAPYKKSPADRNQDGQIPLARDGDDLCGVVGISTGTARPLARCGNPV